MAPPVHESVNKDICFSMKGKRKITLWCLSKFSMNMQILTLSVGFDRAVLISVYSREIKNCLPNKSSEETNVIFSVSSAQIKQIVPSVF